MYRSSTLLFRLNFCIISQLFTQDAGPASNILFGMTTVTLRYHNVFQFDIVKPVCVLERCYFTGSRMFPSSIHSFVCIAVLL